MINPFKTKFLATVGATVIATSLGFFSPPATAASGLQNQLNSMFDSMANVTPPGVFETQRRGVISGGRVTIKNKMFNENLVSLTPPSWKGGCGGLDMFGGAFSFINSEQLTQLLRAVAANAVSYAFKLALDNMCPTCAKILETLQKKIQELNQFMGNSCQLAQGIVNDVVSAFDTQEKVGQKSDASAKGFFEDWFAGWSESGGESATEKLASNDPELLKTGNIVWRQMKRSNTASWFRTTGDDRLLEAILSITGSVIIHEPGTKGADSDTQTITEVPGNKISLGDLVDGGDVTMYSCSGDSQKCMQTNNQNAHLIGLKTQLEDVLLGSSNLPGDGLVGKYAHNSGAPTPTEAAIASNLDLGLGAMLFNLATISESTARQFVMQLSGAIAANMAYTVGLESLRAAQAALAGEDSAYIVKVQETLTRSRRTIESQYQGLQARYGKINEAVALYNDVIANVRQSRYVPGRKKIRAK